MAPQSGTCPVFKQAKPNNKEAQNTNRNTLIYNICRCAQTTGKNFTLFSLSILSQTPQNALHKINHQGRAMSPVPGLGLPVPFQILSILPNRLYRGMSSTGLNFLFLILRKSPVTLCSIPHIRDFLNSPRSSLSLSGRFPLKRTELQMKTPHTLYVQDTSQLHILELQGYQSPRKYLKSSFPLWPMHKMCLLDTCVPVFVCSPCVIFAIF